jgi:hypothetical protein
MLFRFGKATVNGRIHKQDEEAVKTPEFMLSLTVRDLETGLLSPTRLDRSRTNYFGEDSLSRLRLETL